MIKTIPVLLLLALDPDKNLELANTLSQVLNQTQGIITSQPTLTTNVPALGETQPTATASPVNPAIKDKMPSDPKEDLSCTMLDGRKGECVHVYLCNDNNTVITDGETLIDMRQVGPLRSNDSDKRIRQGESTQDVCVSYLDVCCAVPNMSLPELPLKPKPKPDESERKGCGWANPDGVGLLSDDMFSVAKFGEFPWMIVIVEKTNNTFVGGGSLIHPSIVLTSAALYVAATDPLKVRAGEWDTQTTREIYRFQEREISSAEVHENFNKGNLIYNVALLFLASPMKLGLNVGVICLPPPNVRQEDGTRCIATGWGKDRFGKEGKYSTILKKIELPVVGNDKCQARLRTTRLRRFFQLHSSFMCAGGEPSKDTCRGDGGSPLACPIQNQKDRYVQSGIVSWGIGCREEGIPGVYADVSVVRDWIDEKVSANWYSTKAYTY